MFRKKTRIISLVSTASVALAPLAFVVSCGNKDVGPGFANHDYNKLEWNNIGYWDAEIIKWIDGDTPIVNVTKIHNMTGTGFLGRQNIRLVGIDTPELHVMNPDTGKIDKLTEGKEFEWAEKGRLFGEKVAPKGTKIRIKTTGGMTYNRYSGGIYYGNGTAGDFSKNFSVEISKAGLTLPFITNPIDALLDKNIAYVYRGIADAYNYARRNGIGIFSKSENIKEIYGVHGQIDVSAAIDHGNDKENKRLKSIYYYTKDLKEI